MIEFLPFSSFPPSFPIKLKEQLTFTDTVFGVALLRACSAEETVSKGLAEHTAHCRVGSEVPHSFVQDSQTGAWIPSGMGQP